MVTKQKSMREIELEHIERYAWPKQLQEIVELVQKIVLAKGNHYKHDYGDAHFPTDRECYGFTGKGLHLAAYGRPEDAYHIMVMASTTEGALDSIPFFELKIRPNTLWIEMLRQLAKDEGPQPGGDNNLEGSLATPDRDPVKV